MQASKWPNCLAIKVYDTADLGFGRWPHPRLVDTNQSERSFKSKLEQSSGQRYRYKHRFRHWSQGTERQMNSPKSVFKNRKIPIKTLYFGETDGYQEYLNLRDASLPYTEVFSDPPGLEFTKFTKDNASAFVVGGKGEGKTALLSLIRDRIRRHHSGEKYVQPVSYDWDFNVAKRKRISKLLGIKLAEKRPEEEGLMQFEQEFKIAWRWFIHKLIYDALSSDDFKEFVKKDAVAKRYVSLFKGIDGGEDRSFFSWFPKLTDGNVTFKGDVAFLNAEFNANFEVAEQTSISMEAMLDQLDSIVFSFKSLPKDITIILDEIELRFDDAEDWARDIQYIHDLIYVSSIYIDRLRDNEINIQFIIALRKSVVIAVMRRAEPRVKTALEAYSTPIQWYETGELKHCAFSGILKKKVSASEKAHYGENYKDPSDPWRWLKYFPAEMGNGEPFLTWLLSKTFWRPRDIVRFFKVCVDNMTPKQKESTTFDQGIFSDYVLDLYSRSQWAELSEDMNTIFSEGTVSTVQGVLRGLDSSFTYDELIAALSEVASAAENEENYSAESVVKFLFELGIIGNSERINGQQVERWSFQRCDEIDPKVRLRLHDVMQLALRS